MTSITSSAMPARGVTQSSGAPTSRISPSTFPCVESVTAGTPCDIAITARCIRPVTTIAAPPASPRTSAGEPPVDEGDAGIGHRIGQRPARREVVGGVDADVGHDHHVEVATAELAHDLGELTRLVEPPPHEGRRVHHRIGRARPLGRICARGRREDDVGGVFHPPEPCRARAFGRHRIAQERHHTEGGGLDQGAARGEPGVHAPAEADDAGRHAERLRTLGHRGAADRGSQAVAPVHDVGSDHGEARGIREQLDEPLDVGVVRDAAAVDQVRQGDERDPVLLALGHGRIALVAHEHADRARRVLDEGFEQCLVADVAGAGCGEQHVHPARFDHARRAEAPQIGAPLRPPEEGKLALRLVEPGANPPRPAVRAGP